VTRIKATPNGNQTDSVVSKTNVDRSQNGAQSVYLATKEIVYVRCKSCDFAFCSWLSKQTARAMKLRRPFAERRGKQIAAYQTISSCCFSKLRFELATL